MTKKDLQLLSEIYDNTRREKPGEVGEDISIPQDFLDTITESVDTLSYVFSSNSKLEKYVIAHYGPGFSKDFAKLKEHTEGIINIWDSLLYEMDPGPDDPVGS